MGFTRYRRCIPFLIWKRRRKIRVSLAAFLIAKNDSRYALVELRSRPGSFGPFGGVFKVGDDSAGLSNNVEFSPQYRGECDADDLNGDLRGYIDGRKLYSLVRWFEQGEGRESGIDCINRELKEELKEVSSRIQPPEFSSINLRRVRTVIEGPRYVSNRDYLQFHIFEIWEPTPSDEWKDFVRKLVRFSDSSDKVSFVTADDIYAGRITRSGDGSVRMGPAIGHHAEFLIRSYSARPELPPMTR